MVRGVVGDDYQLSRRALTLDGHLQIANSTRVGAIGVEWEPMRHETLPDGLAHLVDQRVVDLALWDVNDTVRAKLEDSDFRLSYAPAHRQARAVSKAEPSAFAQRGRGQARARRQLGKCVARGGSQAWHAKAWAPRTRRTMRTVKLSKRPHGAELEPNPGTAPKYAPLRPKRERKSNPA